MCLDAWMTSGSGQDSDSQKKKWLKETDNPLRQTWPSVPGKEASLLGLKQIGEVEDMRPGHSGERKKVSDANNFEEVIEFIHQIRCNLFHGGKSYVNVHDRRLVELSSELLEGWIQWTLDMTE
jgi:hypothetical protein